MKSTSLRQTLLEPAPFYETLSEAFYERVREGDSAGVEDLLERYGIDKLFPNALDLEQANNTFASTLTRSAIHAGEAGVSPLDIGTLYRKFMRRCRNASSVDEVRAIASDALLSYAKLIEANSRERETALVMDVLQYIANNIFNPIIVADIAQQLNMSLSSLEHRFKQESGITIMQAIKHEKIKQACQMLSETDLSCAEIAAKLNYCSQSYFSKCFKEEVGVSPLAYRKKRNALIIRNS